MPYDKAQIEQAVSDYLNPEEVVFRIKHHKYVNVDDYGEVYRSMKFVNPGKSLSGIMTMTPIRALVQTATRYAGGASFTQSRVREHIFSVARRVMAKHGIYLKDDGYAYPYEPLEFMQYK